MNNLDLAPVLQRDIDQRVNTAARHAIRVELAHLRRLIQGTRRAPASITMPSGGSFPTARAAMLDSLGLQADTLRQLADMHFGRPHGKACLDCGRRPVFVTMGHTTTDFCQPCLERIEEMQYRRHR